MYIVTIRPSRQPDFGTDTSGFFVSHFFYPFPQGVLWRGRPDQRPRTTTPSCWVCLSDRISSGTCTHTWYLVLWEENVFGNTKFAGPLMGIFVGKFWNRYGGKQGELKKLSSTAKLSCSIPVITLRNLL